MFLLPHSRLYSLAVPHWYFISIKIVITSSGCRDYREYARVCVCMCLNTSARMHNEWMIWGESNVIIAFGLKCVEWNAHTMLCYATYSHIDTQQMGAKNITTQLIWIATNGQKIETELWNGICFTFVFDSAFFFSCRFPAYRIHNVKRHLNYQFFSKCIFSICSLWVMSWMW